MGETNTTSKVMSGSNDTYSNASDIIKVYYQANIQKKDSKNKLDWGYEIEQNAISSFQLIESFFNKLPLLTIDIYDTGEWTNTFLFQPGECLRLRVVPRLGNEDEVVKPYIDSFFNIETVSYVCIQDSGKYIYRLNCIYHAESYLNKVCEWPHKLGKIQEKIVGYDENSEVVVKNIVGEGGLKFKYMLTSDPSDKMFWLNKTMKCCDFVNKIIDHSWIGMNDAPVTYVDRDGTFYYDSLNRLCGQTEKIKYMYQTLYRKRQAAQNKVGKIIYDRPYTDLSIYNIPINAFRKGLVVNSIQYNPYNKKELNTDNMKPQKVEDEEVISFRKSEFSATGSKLSNVSNKSSHSIKNLCEKEYSGIYFKELHEYYNVAPLHHANMKDAFFTRFVLMTLNITDQHDVDYNQSGIPRLGDKVYIDASDVKYANRIQSGNHIVSGMVHAWAANNAYTICLQCVNDGAYDPGQLTQTMQFEREQQNKKK